MTSYIAFCKKEFLDILRTYKLAIMLATFAILGLISPFTAKILPEILSGMDMGGVIIELPEASAFDSWTQFFKNISQLGTVVMVIIFCGITANELAKGTLVNILTKGLNRHVVILAKLTVPSLIWTLCYLLSLGVALGYTIYFWGVEPLPHAILAFTCLWVFGLLLIALMILGGICLGNVYGSLLAVVATVIVLNLINIAPMAHKYNPISLAGGTLSLLNEQKIPEDFIPALVICVASIVVAIIVSIAVFDRKQL